MINCSRDSGGVDIGVAIVVFGSDEGAVASTIGVAIVVFGSNEGAVASTIGVAIATREGPRSAWGQTDVLWRVH